MFAAMFQEPKKLRKSEPLRRPTGMNREVYALLYNTNGEVEEWVWGPAPFATRKGSGTLSIQYPYQ